jgi:hypothetical protein
VATTQQARIAKEEAARLAEEDAARVQDRAAAAERVIDDTDDILADIDSILEEQQVLLNFRQRGGQ